MSTATEFDNNFYLTKNQDVADAVSRGDFLSSLEHFETFGIRELRAPNELFSPSYYFEKNPDVSQEVASGKFKSIFQHFQLFGERENRTPSMDFDGFKGNSYLLENPDVAFAVSEGIFSSAIDHFISFGRFEGRPGSGIQPKAFTLTAGPDDLLGSIEDDRFLGNLATVSMDDKLDGAGGNDSLEISIQNLRLGALNLPLPQNISGLEQISMRLVNDPVISEDVELEDQLIDFSDYSNVENIQIIDGSSLNDATITLNLAQDQSLYLSNLQDGDTESNVVEDGGLKILQAPNTETFNLHIDNIGKNVPSAKEALVLELDNAQLQELNLNVANTNTLFFYDTGSSAIRLNINGSGTTVFGALPSDVEELNASLSNAHLNFTIEHTIGNVETGAGSDNISVISGQNDITTADGDDVLKLLDGQTQLSTQDGNDEVTVTGGINSVGTGAGNDNVTFSGGSNSLNSGTGNDIVASSGGTNTLDSGAGDDNVTLSGGDNILDTGDGDDTVLLEAGKNTVNTGEGDDVITFVDGENELDAGLGDDTLRIISSGTVTVPTTANVESFFISDTVHQSLDFSFSASVGSIELDSGTTTDNATINTTLGSGQSIILDSITDGDSAAASLADGGIKISQADSISILELTLDDIGPSAAATNSNVFIDIAGQGVTTANITSANDSFIILENSGAILNTLNLTGSGTLGIMGALANSVTTINGTNSAANLTLTSGLGDDTITVGSGNDTVTLTGGTNSVSTSDGNDTVNLSTGSDTVTTGSGDDSVVAAAGTNNITTGEDDDQITLTGGTNTVNTGADDDIVNASGGDNSITTEGGSDQVTLSSSGTTTLNTGLDNDVVNASAGTNTITTEGGNDQITISGGTNTINTGDGDDTLSLSAGINFVSSGDGDDVITASGGASNVDIRSLDGGPGTDRLNVISTGNVTIPTASNVESFFISDTVHQSLDFSLSTSLNGIELDSGTTIDNSSITLTLGAGQALTLDSITDGDTAAAAVGDGGITIAQAASLTSLDLTLDDVGPSTSTTNENVFIDIAGTGVATAKVTSGNDSFVVISNTGGSLAGIELLGSGKIALGTLPTSITNINGAAATANLTLTIGSSGVNTFRGGIGDDAVTLTGGTNDVQTGDGDDIITTSTNLASGDRIDGGNGTDTLEVIHTGLATIPTTTNLTSIESIAIQDTVHQTLDFSALTSITGIELDSGTTLDGATIVTTIGANQTLTLDSITDGDTAAASLADGGIKISQANSLTALDLTLDDIGPNSATTNTNLFVDIAGTGVATANIISVNDSFIVLENSGAALSVLNLTGSGTFGIQGTLPDSVTTINGSDSTANLTVTSGAGNDTITGGTGNDSITLTGGTNNVTGGNGNDTIILSTGNDTVNTGSGDDNVTAAAGTNNISTGANEDQITLTGGTNTVNTGDNNDVVNSSGGDSNITTESGSDQVTLSGAGTNTVNTGSDNDVVNASAGSNNITTESGSDQVTLSGGTNTVSTGSNGDTINVSGGVNNITTAGGGDQVTFTGGTNTVDTGSGGDTVTLSSGTDTVDTGSGNDTVEAGGTLTTADTIDGGANTDTIASTVAMTDALAARLSNFEIFDIKGSGGVTHDVSTLTGLTSLKVSASLTGAVVVTDLAVGAEVDISAGIANNLTINQINAAGGGTDTLTFDFSGGTYTTGASIIAPNIETVTIKTSAGGTKTVSGATYANAGTLNITASSANLTISDLTAVNLETFDVSSTGSRTTNITTGADVFSQALTYTGGGGNDTLDLDGATFQNTFVYNGGNGNDALEMGSAALQNTFSYNGGSGDDSLNLNAAVLSGALTFDGGSGDDTLNLDGATVAAGSVFVVGDDQDTLILNADAVASVVRSSATTSNNAFSVQDDVTTAHTSGFTSGSDTFDYNGSLSHGSTTAIVKAAGASLQAAVAADADATVYVIQDADGDADFETALNSFADSVSNSRANTLETEAVDTGLLSYSGLDTAFASSDIVLIAIDSETNEDGTTANDGGTAIYRFRNSDTTTADTVLTSEIELIGVFQDAAISTADFI